MFEKASRFKYRWASVRGQLSAEELWDLPLTSKSGFDLDNVARTVNNELKAMAEESFVQTAVNQAKADTEVRLEIVKYIISVRLTEQTKRLDAARRADSNYFKALERAKLKVILEKKQDAALEDLSVEEIQKRLDELNL